MDAEHTGNGIDEKRKEFCEILKSLTGELFSDAKSDAFKNVMERLDKLYTKSGGNDFRHFYSDIFSVMVDPPNDSNVIEAAEMMASNAAFIWENCRTYTDDQDVVKSIGKLYDHISLEYARINYTNREKYDITTEPLEAQMDAVNNTIETVKEKIQSTGEKVDKASEKIQSVEKEFVAILGIFAAIVITVNS